MCQNILLFQKLSPEIFGNDWLKKKNLTKLMECVSIYIQSFMKDKWFISLDHLKGHLVSSFPRNRKSRSIFVISYSSIFKELCSLVLSDLTGRNHPSISAGLVENIRVIYSPHARLLANFRCFNIVSIR